MKIVDKIIGIIAMGFFMAIGILLIITPEKKMSELENRYLQSMPEFTSERLFSGEWGQEMEAYLIDQFPAREGWVGIDSAYERYVLGKKELGGIYVAGRRMFPKTTPPNEVFERNIGAIERIFDWADMPVYVMMPPSATTVLAAELPAYAPYYDEKYIIQKVLDAIGEQYVIDVLPALKAAGEGDNLYFYSDHHWTAYGAYQAYVAYVTAAGMQPLPRSSFTVETVTRDFHGTSYAKAGLWWFPAEDIDILIPAEGYQATVDGGSLFDESKLNTYDKYAYFLGGNQPLQVIESNANTGRALMLIKDSYAHILVPMLTLHFDQIILLDPRYIAVNPYGLMEQYHPTDLLILMNANNMGQENGLSLFLRYQPQP